MNPILSEPLSPILVAVEARALEQPEPLSPAESNRPSKEPTPQYTTKPPPRLRRRGHRKGAGEPVCPAHCGNRCTWDAHYDMYFPLCRACYKAAPQTRQGSDVRKIVTAYNLTREQINTRRLEEQEANNVILE